MKKVHLQITQVFAKEVINDSCLNVVISIPSVFRPSPISELLDAVRMVPIPTTEIDGVKNVSVANVEVPIMGNVSEIDISSSSKMDVDVTLGETIEVGDTLDVMVKVLSSYIGIRYIVLHGLPLEEANNVSSLILVIIDEASNVLLPSVQVVNVVDFASMVVVYKDS